MLIRKFNRLIKSKILWGIFAVIVCVAFIGGGYLSTAGKSRNNADKSNKEGILYGSEVNRDEFYNARLFEMGLRTDMALTPEQKKILREHTWTRLAILKKAETMGISAYESEIRQAIQADQTFWENGRFSDQKYTSTLRNYFSKRSDPIGLYWEYQRQSIVMRKFFLLIEQSTWVSPYEFNYNLNNLTDEFTLEYSRFKSKDFSDPDINVTDDEARSFYTENSDLFTEPERIKIAYITFPATNYIDDTVIDAGMTEEYYSMNTDKYLTTNMVVTNIIETAMVETNLIETPVTVTNMVTSTLSLATVSNEVVQDLRLHRARYNARSAATDFMIKISGSAAVSNLITAATEEGLQVNESAYISYNDTIPGIDAYSEFYSTAFKLNKSDSGRNISDPIQVGDNVYLISLMDKIESHVPEYDKIADVVIPLAKSNAVTTAFLKKMDNIRDSVIEAMDKDTNVTFTSSMQNMKYQVSTTESFNIYSGPSTNDAEEVRALISGLMLLSKGEITKPAATDEGAIIGFVSDRQPGNIFSTQTLTPQIIPAISYQRAETLFSEIGAYLLKEGKMKDYRQTESENNEDNTM